MDYVSFLGKKISNISLEPSDYILSYDDLGLDEGIEPGCIAKAKDGRFEMKLTLETTITVIFLYPVNGRFDGFDLDANEGKRKVLEKFGMPSQTGSEMDIPILGPTGGYDRYDFESYSIHFEYSPGQQRTALITIMLPEIVQGL